MAVGDDAIDAGYPIVPDTGIEGLVRYGAREINRTRDFVAIVKDKVPGKITISSTLPSGGVDGDIWLLYTP